MKASRIPTEIDRQVIVCRETNCLFKSYCANHKSAGDYRKESGFSPDLFEENKVVYCRTKHSPKMPDIIDVKPIEYEIMNRGTVYLGSDGELHPRIYINASD